MTARGRRLATPFLYWNPHQINELLSFSVRKRHSSRFGGFFAWQDGCDYRQWFS
jgi:hypothetical protein